MNPAMEIHNASLHSLFIFFPRYAIHSRCSLFLQQIEAVQQQSLVDVVQERCEL
jgi:hypothetical protein